MRARDRRLLAASLRLGLLLVASMASGCTRTPTYTPSPTPTPLSYYVRVEDGDGQEIDGAKVTMMIPPSGLAPMVEHTDDEGVARFSIPDKCIGQPAELIVAADGCVTSRRHIDLTADSPSKIVPLQCPTPMKMPSPSPSTVSPTAPTIPSRSPSPLPEPTVTPSATLTVTTMASPSPTQSATPSPTSTPTVVPAPSPNVVLDIPQEPELVSPEPGECVTHPPTLEWRGSPAYTYEVTVRHVRSGDLRGESIVGTTWQLHLPADEFGEWQWSVSLGDSSSDEWHFYFDPFTGCRGRTPQPDGRPPR